MNRRVQIVGGGLAGLTLGIGLRHRDVPVTITEAGQYPRHRVCGEFISGEGLNVVRRLGVYGLLQQAGARAATTAAFFDHRSGTSPLALPKTALCISRYALDQLLATEFRRLGGELIENQRDAFPANCEGRVRATGRRALPGQDGLHWFGLKAHVHHVTLTADLEMHTSPHGYVGLCRVEGGTINVCGLFHREKSDEGFRGNPRDWLRGEPDSPLRQRLGNAVFDEASICSVAGLSLRPGRAREHRECCIGDTITMIPPITGNGMSMAFESAEMAIAPLASWSRGETSWDNTSREIAEKCDAAFGSRLRWAACLQNWGLRPSFQRAVLWLTNHSDWSWRWGFARTR
jgi:2-polyprenyl-6-methoxyphenol hydroxylase-like FAD-dependent oxidoreductase